MRIAIDARRIRDFGVGTYIRNLLQALSEAAPQHEYELIAYPDDRQYFIGLPSNFRIHKDARRDSSRWDHLDLPRLLHRIAPDVTHIPFHRVPLLIQKPYVVTIHDLSSLYYDDAKGLLHQARTFRLKRGIKRADRIICVSEATKRDTIDLCPSVADRTRLIYSAPDPEFFRHDLPHDARAAGPDAEARERARILERYQIHYPFLLYAGSIRPHKNIPRLIEAFAVARATLEKTEEFKDLRLIVIGDDISLHPAVRRAVMHSRVEHCVRFLGYIPFGTLRVFHELATAFVFPSLYEGFGLPPLEAMASGTPVVASSVSSLPEVVGGAAHLVNPENVFDIARGIAEVLLDKDLRAKLIVKGLIQAQRFNWQKTARAVLEVYEEVQREKAAPTRRSP